MKHRMVILGTALSLVLIPVLTACSGGKDEDKDGKIQVMTSFYPMYDFAVKVAGDKAEVVNMTPAGTEPHDWEPAATDIRNLEDADVFIYNGAGLEQWTKDVLDTLDNKNLVVVEASKGLDLIEGEHHDHEDLNAEDKEAEDPHVWLNPLNGKAEMENIKDALVQADPENKDYYTKNYETYAKEFDQLDQEYREKLTPLKKKDIVVAHEAFGYLCQAYGLNQVGIEGLTPDSEPDPARMEEIIQFAKKHDVKTIFFEELVSPKVAKTIASEIGAETAVLNPLEGLTEEQQKEGEDYFSVMESNLTELVRALQ